VVPYGNGTTNDDGAPHGNVTAQGDGEPHDDARKHADSCSDDEMTKEVRLKTKRVSIVETEGGPEKAPIAVSK
jgi:hypothetical protein